jgi:hypothetical protein
MLNDCSLTAKENLGLSRCNALPALIKGMITTPEDFFLTPTEAVDADEWQDALLAGINTRAYFWPPFVSLKTCQYLRFMKKRRSHIWQFAMVITASGSASNKTFAFIKQCTRTVQIRVACFWWMLKTISSVPKTKMATSAGSRCRCCIQKNFCSATAPYQQRARLW